ncbi:MAG: hypothetical protein JWN93_1999 [Hyphomicrobiales bacterium]|nr:hypothetical protein [Hyphomicrobiales bacterium]
MPDAPTRSSEPSRVDPRLLEILVCPVCKGPLEYDAVRQELISRTSRIAFPIRDGIPIMLPEEARVFDLEREGQALKSRGEPGDTPDASR